MIPVRLLGTGSALAGRRVSTAELAARALPHQDPGAVAARIGIRSRYWVEPGTPAARLASEALRGALDTAGLSASALRRLIFVSSTSGDSLSPATAHAVCAELGLDDTCDGFDLSNACTGFLSAFDVAARSVATGLAPVAVVAAETFSRYLSPDRPRPWLVMADAAGAVVLGAPRPGEGVLAVRLRSSAELRGQVTIGHPAVTGEPSSVDFGARHDALAGSAVRLMAQAARAVAAEAGVPLAEVEWFLPHQPNGRILDALTRELEVGADRLVPVVDEVGSVGAASIPVSLDRLWRSRGLRAGERLLLAAVGAGTGYGALLHRVAP